MYYVTSTLKRQKCSKVIWNPDEWGFSVWSSKGDHFIRPPESGNNWIKEKLEKKETEFCCNTHQIVTIRLCDKSPSLHFLLQDSKCSHLCPLPSWLIPPIYISISQDHCILEPQTLWETGKNTAKGLVQEYFLVSAQSQSRNWACAKPPQHSWLSAVLSLQATRAAFTAERPKPGRVTPSFPVLCLPASVSPLCTPPQLTFQNLSSFPFHSFVLLL